MLDSSAMRLLGAGGALLVSSMVALVSTATHAHSQPGASAVRSVQDLRASAESGDAAAQAELGERLAREGSPSADLAEALRWMTRAAEQGNGRGQSALGIAFENGLGVAPDLGEARRLYTLAAAQDNARGKLRLASLLLSGRGGPRNPAEAARLLRSSPGAEAAMLLGTCFSLGDCASRDVSEAARWYHIAADGGNRVAKALLGVSEIDAINTRDLGQLYQRFVVDPDALKRRDTWSAVLVADERLIELFPDTTSLDLIARVASKRGPLLFTITGGVDACAGVQRHIATFTLDELQPRSAIAPADLVDFKIAVNTLPESIRRRASVFTSAAEVKEYDADTFGETVVPTTTLFSDGNRFGSMTALRKETPDTDLPLFVDRLRRAFIVSLKNRGFYAVADDPVPVGAASLNAKERLFRVTTLVDHRVLELRLLASCYGQAEAFQATRLAEIRKQMDANNEFIKAADEILSKAGYRINAKSQLRYIDEELEVSVRLFERKTGEHVDRNSSAQTRDALRRLRSLSFTAEELEAVRQALKEEG